MQQAALRPTPWSLILALALVAGTGTYFARALRYENAPTPVASWEPPAGRPAATPAPASARIAATIPAAGQVTAALYTRAGALVRTLVRQVALPAGRVGLSWDGRDERGQAVPPGASGTTRAVPAAVAAGQRTATKPRTGAYIVLLLLMLGLLGGLVYLLGRSLGYFHTGSASPVAVASVIGQPPDQATTTLRGQGFNVATQQLSSDATANTVFDRYLHGAA